MNPALGASICLLGLVYPFAVYIGVERWPSAWLPAAMALLWLARALLLPANRPAAAGCRPWPSPVAWRSRQWTARRPCAPIP